MTPTAPQSPSPERRKEVRALWKKYGFRPFYLFGNYWDKEDGEGDSGPAYPWQFIAALDAHHATRTRAEVEVMRKRCAKVAKTAWLVGDYADIMDATELERMCEETSNSILSIPIEGDGR